MTMMFFLKPAYTAPSFGGRVLGDTESARKRRARQRRLEEEQREQRKQLNRLKKQKAAAADVAVPFIPEVPLFESVPFDLHGYVEDLMRSAIQRMRRVRDLWLFIELMFGDDDD